MNRDGLGLALAAALVAAAAGATPAGAQAPRAPLASVQAAPLDAAARKAVVEGLIAKIDAQYVFPEKVPAIAGRSAARLRPAASTARPIRRLSPRR